MLRLEDLTKVYPNGTRALNGVTLTIPTGQFVSVIGLSGSGKSTLLRCINRLVEPTSGRVFLDDIEVTAATDLRCIRRRIGMIFQHFNLVKRSTVLTNVLSGRLGYTSPVASLFHVFGTQDYVDAQGRVWHGSGSAKRRPSARILCREASSSGWASRGRLCRSQM